MPQKVKSGYTLIELVTVMAIIILVTLAAIPAFNTYGRNQDFNQQIELVKQAINQTYLLSRNPEKNIHIYELVPGADDKSLVLRSHDSAGAIQTVREIFLLENEVLQYPASDPPSLTCIADPRVNCTTSVQPFSFIDGEIGSVNYAITTAPFSVTFNKTN